MINYLRLSKSCNLPGKFAPFKSINQAYNLAQSRHSALYIRAENTHLKGKYHCTADLLFILFEFSCFAYVELATDLLVCLNQNQSNRRRAIQQYFPLW